MNNNQQNQCPEGCCQEGDILCISIPCPVQIVLLGIPLQLELPCLRLSSGAGVTTEQINQIIQVLTNILGSLNIPTQA